MMFQTWRDVAIFAACATGLVVTCMLLGTLYAYGVVLAVPVSDLRARQAQDAAVTIVVVAPLTGLIGTAFLRRGRVAPFASEEPDR